MSKRTFPKLGMALALTTALVLPARAQDRPDPTIAVDNLWETMGPVIGISTSGARVHDNLFDTLAMRD